MEKTNYIISAFVTGFTFLFGSFDTSILALVIAMVLDYVTGCTNSLYNGKALSSKIGFKGIMKKIGILVAIIVGNLLDIVMKTDVVRTMVIYFFLANEFISILENLKGMGLPIPDKLIGVINTLTDEKEEKNTKNGGVKNA